MNLKQAEQLFILMRLHGVRSYRDGRVRVNLRPRASKRATGQSEALDTKSPLPQDNVKLVTNDLTSAVTTPSCDISVKINPALHHENEVMNMLKLSDNDLVDKLFPEG